MTSYGGFGAAVAAAAGFLRNGLGFSSSFLIDWR